MDGSINLRKLKPLTKDQEVFIESMKSVNPPKRKTFNVYWRFIKRKEIVKSQKLNDNKPLIKDDRADWKRYVDRDIRL